MNYSLKQPLGLEAWAEWEAHQQRRDGEIAAHRGLSVKVVTHTRETCFPLWEMWERRLLTETYGPLDIDPERKAREDRRQQAAVRRALARELWAKGQTLAEAERAESEAEEWDGWEARVMQSVNRAIPFCLVLIALYLAGTWLAHHGMLDFFLDFNPFQDWGATR